MPSAVSAFFDAERWDVLSIDESPVPGVRGAFRGENGEWFVDVFWFPEFEHLVVLSVATSPVPDESREAVAGYLTFVNFGLPLGNFELSPETGDFRCKTSVSIAEADLTAEIVARHVYANVALMDRYLPGVEQVLDGVDADYAYDAVDG